MRQQTIRILLIIAGWLCVILGVIGIVLPLLPTTPFILLAAFCFARSSDKFHHWLVTHHYFGPIIQRWEENKAIPRNVRNFTIVFMWCGMSFSMYMLQQLWATLFISSIGICVSIFLLRLKTY